VLLLAEGDRERDRERERSYTVVSEYKSENWCVGSFHDTK